MLSLALGFRLGLVNVHVVQSATCTLATSQLVTRSAHHMVMSSLCQLVTSQIVSYVFFTESAFHNAVIHDGQRHAILGDFKVLRVDWFSARSPYAPRYC